MKSPVPRWPAIQVRTFPGITPGEAWAPSVVAVDQVLAKLPATDQAPNAMAAAVKAERESSKRIEQIAFACGWASFE